MNAPHDLGAADGGSPSPTAEVHEDELATEPEELGQGSGVVQVERSASMKLPDQPPTELDGEAPESQQTAATPGIPVPAAPSGADAPRRTLKLVLTLKPGDGPSAIQVIMAIGAEGCDPLLWSGEVEDLQAALDPVPGLLAEAEARWQSQPRYPRVPPRTGAGAASSRSKEPSQPLHDGQRVDLGIQQPAGQPITPKPSSSQLSLFD